MNPLSVQTISKNSLYTIMIDQDKNRAYLFLKGKWENPTELENYMKDVNEAISNLKPDFTLLVDLTQYGGTCKELYNLHVDSLKLAVKSGLIKAAEVFSNNPLLKLLFESYCKESGVSAMEFSDSSQAERWLDLYSK